VFLVAMLNRGCSPTLELTRADVIEVPEWTNRTSCQCASECRSRIPSRAPLCRPP